MLLLVNTVQDNKELKKRKSVSLVIFYQMKFKNHMCTLNCCSYNANSIAKLHLNAAVAS